MNLRFETYCHIYSFLKFKSHDERMSLPVYRVNMVLSETDVQ